MIPTQILMPDDDNSNEIVCKEIKISWKKRQTILRLYNFSAKRRIHNRFIFIVIVKLAACVNVNELKEKERKKN